MKFIVKLASYVNHHKTGTFKVFYGGQKIIFLNI